MSNKIKKYHKLIIKSMKDCNVNHVNPILATFFKLHHLNNSKKY